MRRVHRLSLSAVSLLLLSTCTVVRTSTNSLVVAHIMIAEPAHTSTVRGYELNNLASVLATMIADDFRATLGEVDASSLPLHDSPVAGAVPTISVDIIPTDLALPAGIATVSTDDGSHEITWFSLQYVVRAPTGEIKKRGVIQAQGIDPASISKFQEQQRFVLKGAVIKLRHAVRPALGS